MQGSAPVAPAGRCTRTGTSPTRWSVRSTRSESSTSAPSTPRMSGSVSGDSAREGKASITGASSGSKGCLVLIDEGP